MCRAILEILYSAEASYNILKILYSAKASYNIFHIVLGSRIPLAICTNSHRLDIGYRERDQQNYAK